MQRIRSSVLVDLPTQPIQFRTATIVDFRKSPIETSIYIVFVLIILVLKIHYKAPRWFN